MHWRRGLGARPDLMPGGRDRAVFEERFDRHFPALFRLFHDLYGARPDWLDQLTDLVMQSARSWAERPAELKGLDAEREHNSGWFQSNTMLGGVCYVDRYAEDLEGVRARIPYFKELGLTYLHLMPLFLAPEPHSDGGYAVSSYRDVNPGLGTMEQLRDLAAELRANGISLVVDFIFNHTSDEHEWARKAAEGEPALQRLLLDLPGPDHAGRVRANRARDLPGRPSRLIRAFAGRTVGLGHVPHLPVGPELLQPGRLPGHGRARCSSWPTRAWTSCGWTPSPSSGSSSERPVRTCPEAHTLLQAFNAVCRLAAPSLLFKSEAIVHPDEVARYIDPAECQLSYNPLQMALIWEALATRDVSLLAAGPGAAAQHSGRHGLGELRPQPRRHRLDVCG